MEERLNYAPCGYLSISPDGKIIKVNQTLLNMLGFLYNELINQHIDCLLTAPSRIFFQTYFQPLIKLHGKVDEMYLTLKSINHDVPVLVNSIIRESEGITSIECILVQMNNRNEYENEILLAKRKAEEIYQDSDVANRELALVLKEVEGKQNELLDLNKKLHKLATTDALTGLKNRRFLQEQLVENIKVCTINDSSFSLLLVDVDHFKQVNDTFGHQTGDFILQELALKIEANSREHDIVARFGGEEFIIILPSTGKNDALKIAEKLRSSIETFTWPNTTITISVGVTTYHLGDDDRTMLSNADIALYQSKNAGRNRVSYFTNS